MRLAVITTIAQHPKGFGLHLQNLRWALKDYDPEIWVQCYEAHHLRENVNFVTAPGDPRKFHFFWDDTDKIVRNSGADLFLLMEQDILFTEPPHEQIHAAEPLRISLESDYLSVFDKDRKRLYPRIWEGCTFVTRDALQADVTLGSHARAFNTTLKEAAGRYYTTNSCLANDFRTVQKLVENEPFFDTMFEFSFHCFVNNVPYRSWAEDFNYEVGKNVVHLRGIDMMLHDQPAIYEDLAHTRCVLPDTHPAHEVWKRLLNGCSLMLLLCGAHGPTKLMRENLSNDFRGSREWLRKKINKMLPTAKEWLTEEQYKHLCWAARVVNGPVV
jgi:hypothetical protein